MPASAAGRAARSPDAPLAVTMGDPAGIGPEITLRAYQHRRELGLAPFAVYGDPNLYAERARRLDVGDAG